MPDTYLERGDTLYSPHESSERLFILKKGRVQIYEVTEDGQEITLAVVEEGHVFGEMVLTAQSLQGVYVRAMEPSYVASLRRQDLEDLRSTSPPAPPFALVCRESSLPVVPRSRSRLHIGIFRPSIPGSDRPLVQV